MSRRWADLGYNRTYVELKLAICLTALFAKHGYNRTYVELKRGVPVSQFSGNFVIIALM